MTAQREFTYYNDDDFASLLLACQSLKLKEVLSVPIAAECSQTADWLANRVNTNATFAAFKAQADPAHYGRNGRGRVKIRRVRKQ